MLVHLLLANLLCLFYLAEGQNCGTQSPVIGCLTCTDETSYHRLYDTSLKLMVCSNTTSCAKTTNLVCSECASGFYLNISDQLNVSCWQVDNTNIGCLIFDNGSCLSCEYTYQLINGTCVAKVSNCLGYDESGCAECVSPYELKQNKCEVSSSKCQLFDKSDSRCLSCSQGVIIDASGTFCVSAVDNCIQYDATSAECVLCQPGYFYNGLACSSSQLAGIRMQNLLDDMSFSTTCLDTNSYFNSKTGQCVSITSTLIQHCKDLITVTNNCSLCLSGYYLTNNTCKGCSVAIQNCETCSDGTHCETCHQGYYLLKTTDRLPVCMSCSSYGCELCYSFNENINQTATVKCLSCPLGSVLFDGSCLSCTSANSSFSIQDTSCVSCSNAGNNCMYCSHVYISSVLKSTCTWCAESYYLSNGNCVPIKDNPALTFSTAYEYLGKTYPAITQELRNDQVGLMAACDKTDGYICQCDRARMTSLCGDYGTNIPSVSEIDTGGDLSTFALNAPLFRMAAQFPAFTLSQLSLPSNSFLLSQEAYWNLLSAYTLLIVRQQSNKTTLTSDSSTILNNIKTQTESMKSVLSDEKVTIMTGNGFYYKYVPAGISEGGLGDDSYISTTISSDFWRVIFIFYDRVVDATKPLKLTGNIFVFTNNIALSTFNITVRKNGLIDNADSFTLSSLSLTSGTEPQSVGATLVGATSTSRVTLNEGYLTIASATQGTSYQVSNTEASTTDIYKSQRIEYIFYSESFLYILFFLMLYLIFLPLCTLVDCCESEVKHRKRVNSQEFTDQNREFTEQNRAPSSSSQQEETTIKVNYRDFFPIYNVGNTPRSKRLPKICLFIVNLQHGVTFLTLIYFNLKQGKQVMAIGLAVPAYFCTIIMGYIVGAIFRALPGKSKYLINLFSLGYWVLWVFLMRLFNSQQYKLFLIVFVFIFFFIDLLLDGFEMLLIYFSIRQSQHELEMFKFLARWFSLRGYYELDKLANQMFEQE